MPSRALAPVTREEIEGPEAPPKAYGSKARARAFQTGGAPPPAGSVPEGAPPRREAPSATQSFIDRQRAHLRAFMEQTGKSQTEVARGTGISATVISQFLADKYAGSEPRIAKSIAAWLNLEGRRSAAPGEPAWVETENAKQIAAVLAQCHELRDLGFVYGAAGVGKTRTLRQYQEEHPDTILLTATQAVRYPSAFLRQLAALKEINAPGSGAMDKVFQEIFLRLKDSGRLLIVDDAQCLDFRTLEMIRSLHDQARVGVVLVGDEVLWRRLHEGRTRAEFERLRSRIGIRRCLRPGIPKGDVESVARQYINGADGECIAFLVAKAGGVGGIRSVVKHCRMAFHLAAKRGDSAVTKADLEDAAAILGSDEVGTAAG